MGAVFLVEDEALIRMMIADMVEELGHRVVAEAGSIQAAELLARTTVFDLGILDINIGGFNISPIAEIIDGRGLPFVFVSGYGAKGRPVLFSNRPVLQKPFLISKFAEMINSSLGDSTVIWGVDASASYSPDLQPFRVPNLGQITASPSRFNTR